MVSPAGQLALLDGWGAFGVLFVAVILEIGSYLIPWLDNLLDVVATPAAETPQQAAISTSNGAGESENETTKKGSEAKTSKPDGAAAPPIRHQ